jgi:hypothetical protein
MNNSRTVEQVWAEAYRLQQHPEYAKAMAERNNPEINLKISYLKRVASREVDAALYARFGHEEYLMSRVAGLPMIRQKELAAGGLVLLITNAADGNENCEAIDPLILTPEQVEQVDWT